MSDRNPWLRPANNDTEVREWLESLEWVLEEEGPERARHLLNQMELLMRKRGLIRPPSAITPYLNTIPPNKQAPFPGSREIERRIKSIIRWNAMAMVVRANKDSNVGGHISTFASSATLLEVGFNHFFRAPGPEYGGDLIYFQGHASPGMYSRAFVEGRLEAEQLVNFRHELAANGGLSSYPHPWLMPDFWQFPTVSMGIGPLAAIYQARFQRYLEDRSLKPRHGGKVFILMGDGESDEPEALGALHLAARENLDNLVFCVNCNLQRLDGPVRGNGKIIQELEGVFRGAGWNVIKVVWGSDWDPLLEKDDSGLLVKRMNECVDGDFQKFSVESGAYIREHFFGKYPELLQLVENHTDEQLRKLSRGGHDPAKVYAAFKNAWEHKGAPSVILAKTIKGYGLGEAGEGKNITHQQKKLNVEELREFRSRFGIPISDEDLAATPFFRPAEDSPEMVYLRERRDALGGSLPARRRECEPITMPNDDAFNEFFDGSGGRTISTTFAFVRLLSRLLRDANVGKQIVPIIPDEARTFGMDPLFRQVGIYSSRGQLYEPVDSDQLAYYKEAKDGQILEEGITEAGAMSSFIAAATSYSTTGVPTIPFYVYYSMFGFQRIGDFAWAAGDSRARGFLLGGTAGRTTLNGEGLQHQDGHSHVLSSTIPNLRSYDPAFAYEIAVIVREGIRRMYVDQHDEFYYLTLHNEDTYEMPAMPEGVEDGIVKGLYKFRTSDLKQPAARAHLFGSAVAVPIALRAAAWLEEHLKVAADVWSATSYVELRRDGLDCDRWNRLHPGKKARTPYVAEVLSKEDGVIVAASDYMKILPDGIRPWVPLPLTALGTDGFGRSDTREALRDHFEIDHRFMILAVVQSLVNEGKLKSADLKKVIKDLQIDPEKANPHSA